MLKCVNGVVGICFLGWIFCILVAVCRRYVALNASVVGFSADVVCGGCMEFTAIVDYIETLIFCKLLMISRVTDALG